MMEKGFIYTIQVPHTSAQHPFMRRFSSSLFSVVPYHRVAIYPDRRIGDRNFITVVGITTVLVVVLCQAGMALGVLISSCVG